MRQFINGREVEVPMASDGTISAEEMKKAAQVSPDRPLILQGKDGGNQVINPGERVRVKPDEHFIDMPRHERGFWWLFEGKSNMETLSRHLKELSIGYPLTVSDDCRWLQVHDFALPPAYDRSRTGILLRLPTDYPLSPPGVGSSRVFVDPSLRYQNRKLRDVHENVTPGWGLWAWFCYEFVAWNSGRDNLVKFMEMIRADLTNPPTF